MIKTCPSCGQSKPADQFGRNKSLRDGLSFYCSACNRAKSNAHYRKRRAALGKDVRDHSWIPDGFRWCPSCEQAVAHADYTRNAGAASGWGSRCRACDRAANSDGYFYRKYKFTRRALVDLRAAQGNRCAICQGPEPQHLDHDHETGRTGNCSASDATRVSASFVTTPASSEARPGTSSATVTGRAVRPPARQTRRRIRVESADRPTRAGSSCVAGQRGAGRTTSSVRAWRS